MNTSILLCVALMLVTACAQTDASSQNDAVPSHDLSGLDARIDANQAGDVHDDARQDVDLVDAAPVVDRVSPQDGPASSDGGTAGDSGEACPIAVPITDCNRTVAAADCGGNGDPRLFCGDFGETAECLWFAGGCAATEFTRACNPVIEPECDRGAFGGFSLSPWTLSHEASVTLDDSPTGAGGESVSVECAPCTVSDGAVPPPGWPEGQCLGHEGLCGALLEPLVVLRPSVTSANWGWPSWVAILIVHPSIAGGPMLLVEFDPFDPNADARVCVVWGTDAGQTDIAPVCAIGGTLEVSHVPVARQEAADVHGQLDVSFPDLSPVRDALPFVHGLRIHAEF